MFYYKSVGPTFHAVGCSENVATNMLMVWSAPCFRYEIVRSEKAISGLN